jgi:hypothetical protein
LLSSCLRLRGFSESRSTFPFLFPNGCWLEPG